MKSILNNDGAGDLKRRVNALQPTTQPVWGSMTASEMIHHCNRITQSILEGKAPLKKSTLRQKALKFLFMNITGKLPKNVPAPKKFNIKLNQIIPAEFEIERKEYLDLVERFTTHEDDITLSHPRFGALTKSEWGKFVWMHLDHHLRQFGV